jgi:hypothetical protein
MPVCPVGRWWGPEEGTLHEPGSEAGSKPPDRHSA